MDLFFGIVIGVILTGIAAGIAWHYAECLKYQQEWKEVEANQNQTAHRNIRTDLKALQDRVSIIETTKIAKGLLTQGNAPASSLQAKG